MPPIVPQVTGGSDDVRPRDNSAFSNVSVGQQAAIVIGSLSGVTHVITSVGFSTSGTAVSASTYFVVEIFDGTTPIWELIFGNPGAAGALNILSVTGLNIPSSIAVFTQVQFNTNLANVAQAVTATWYDAFST
jgi:hypothetical protein